MMDVVGTHSLSFRSEVSPVAFARLMFENTDENGNLHLTDWYDVEKDDAVSFKERACKLKWKTEDVDTLIDSYQSLYGDLKRISRRLEELDEAVWANTDPHVETTNGILENDYLEAIYFIYVAPFRATDKEGLEGEVIGRVGTEPCGFEMIRHAQRLCRLMQLNAPRLVIDHEGRMLMAGMANYRYGVCSAEDRMEEFVDVNGMEQ